MKSKLIIAILAVVVSTGCVRITQGGKEIPTLGEQIMELTEAYENGAITEQEFRDLRRKVFRSFMK